MLHGVDSDSDHAEPHDGGSRLPATAVAAVVPLVCYLATASGHGYWLDSGEFIAAATDLDIAHPPGHPLAALVGHLATLLPIGPLAFRVALASAALAAIAAACLFRAVENTLRSAGLRSSRVITPLALAATWIASGSYGWWFQAVRPEVYALHAALAFFAIERVTAFERAWPAHDFRPLYAGAIALGLALANHHFLAILLMPAFAPTLARAYLTRGPRTLLWTASAGVAGLLTYVYLPVRAATNPPLDLGHPTNLSRLFWVVSAEAFQKNTGSGVPQPGAERMFDVIEQLFTSLHPATVLCALGGAYVLFRVQSTRRIAFVWSAVLFVHVLARGWLGFVRDNPDAAGYLMPAFGAAAALAVTFVAVVLRAIANAGSVRPRIWAIALAAMLALLALGQFYRSNEASSLARFAATDAFEEPGQRTLPTGAIVLAHNPESVFRLWGYASSEQARPDVTIIAVPFLTYPTMVDRIVRNRPELTDVLRTYLLQGTLQQADLQTLAMQRPLFIEMDPRIPQALYETLVPSGLYHEVLADGATDTDVEEGAAVQRRTDDRLHELIDVDAQEPETRRQLLWHHYTSALFLAGVAQREDALRETERALSLSPESNELRALAGALREERTEPLDVRHFLPNTNHASNR